jgi:hypothetical protein
MAARKNSTRSAGRSKTPGSEPSVAAADVHQLTIHESRRLSTAEALKGILEYVAQQANAYEFIELGLLTQKAHNLATELVHDIRRTRH